MEKSIDRSPLPVVFGEGWHRYNKELIHPLTPEQARLREERGELYTVVMGDPLAPYCFIEIRGDYFGVGFLDERRREYMSYTFDDLVECKLFLREAAYREYAAQTDRVIRGTVYRFFPDGRTIVEKSEQPFSQSKITEDRMDVSKNWEAKPSFGEYSGLIRKDR